MSKFNMFCFLLIFMTQLSSCLNVVKFQNAPVEDQNQILVCPTDYAKVEGNAVLGTNDFCVMKYEAKQVMGAAVSQAALAPWDFVDQPTAKAACLAIGTGYDLISNSEWMTIARDVESIASNWTGAAVASGNMFRGHTDNTPNNSLDVIDPADIYDGTGNNAGAGEDQKRTFDLSSGDEIWDFSGNVWEWNDWTLGGVLDSGPTTCAAAWVEFPLVACPALAPEDYMPGNPAGVTAANYDASYGVGLMYGDMGGGSHRGGGFGNGADAGAFTLDFSDPPSYTGATVGFRCVYRP